MTQSRIEELMRQSTAGLPVVDVVGPALARAHRIRRRRRVTGGLAVAAAVVVAVAVVPALVPSPGSAHHPQRPGPAAPAARNVTRVMPILTERIVAAPLDPARVDRLPQASLGLPTDLTPPADATRAPAGTAVMVTKERGGDPQEFYALDTHHAWHRMRVASGADLVSGFGPMLDPTGLSPDGHRVALRGSGAAYVVDLRSGLTRRFALPGLSAMHWQGDGRRLLLATDRGEAEVVDTVAGGTQHVPLGPLAYGGAPPAAYDDGTLVHLVGLPHGQGTAFVEQDARGELLRATRTASRSYGLEALLATKGRLAMTASPFFGSDQTSHGEGTGVLVLHRPSYAGLAYLPVRGRTGDYETGGALLARTWVSDHELLLSITPEMTHGGTVERPRQVYLTWDTSTGEVRRVGQAPAVWRDSSWASSLG